MPPRRIRPAVLAPALFAVFCLLLGGCKDQREPAKPIVDLSNTVVTA